VRAIAPRKCGPPGIRTPNLRIKSLVWDTFGRYARLSDNRFGPSDSAHGTSDPVGARLRSVSVAAWCDFRRRPGTSVLGCGTSEQPPSNQACLTARWPSCLAAWHTGGQPPHERGGELDGSLGLGLALPTKVRASMTGLSLPQRGQCPPANPVPRAGRWSPRLPIPTSRSGCASVSRVM